MTKKLAILFDLDDTLLINDMDHFLPGYINALAEALQLSNVRLQRALLNGTKKMLTKNMPANTLEEAFSSIFFPELELNQEKIQEEVIRFYSEGFPKLKYLTQTRPESATIVEKLSAAGHAITIATSPVFPSAAQNHRLSWAGISNIQHMIDDVTSFENYHFSKPHPEYFIEVIIKNQYTHLPVVMIGNSLSDDIVPCEKLGIPTYWITDEEKNPLQGEFSAAGELSEVPQWIEKIADHISPIKFNTGIENAVSLLKTTPAIFDHYCKKYKNEDLTTNTNKEKSSIVKILRHIIEGDKQLNMPRIRQFYQESKPIITGMDLDSISTFSDYANNDYCHLLSQFIDIRTELIEIINKATPEIRNKQAMHTIFGPTTFSDIIQFIAIHDLSHLEQCNEILNRRSN